MRTETEMLQSSGGSLQILHDLQNNEIVFNSKNPWTECVVLLTGGTSVYGGPAIVGGHRAR
jgi:hypothetical protein